MVTAASGLIRPMSPPMLTVPAPTLGVKMIVSAATASLSMVPLTVMVPLTALSVWLCAPLLLSVTASVPAPGCQLMLPLLLVTLKAPVKPIVSEFQLMFPSWTTLVETVIGSALTVSSSPVVWL